MTKNQITQANDNIFADLGFSSEESENLRIRADLMLTLRKLIHMENWTIDQAAQQFGISKSQVEALMQGEIDQFTIDLLVSMLTSAGMKVQIEILPRVA